MRTIILARLFCRTVASVEAVVCLARPASGNPFEWQFAAPETEGLSKEKLDALKGELAKRKTYAFLVIRNDRIVYEWYAIGHGLDKKHGAASLSKGTVAGLALALLVNDRRLKLDTPVADLVAAWKDDPSKRKITLRQPQRAGCRHASGTHERFPHAEAARPQPATNHRASSIGRRG